MLASAMASGGWHLHYGARAGFLGDCLPKTALLNPLWGPRVFIGMAPVGSCQHLPQSSVCATLKRLNGCTLPSYSSIELQ